MDAMLIKLLLLRLRGGVRQRLEQMKTRRGQLYLIVMGAVFALLMQQSAPLSDNPLLSFFAIDPQQWAGSVNQFMPIGLLAAYLLTALLTPSPAIYFNPSEIDFLFCGPFTRRGLLLYKLCSYTFGILLSSALVVVLLPASSYRPEAAFLGAFLTLLFIQLLTVATHFLGQLLSNYVNARVRRRHVFILLMIALAAATGWCYSGVSNGVTGALTQFQSSIGGTLLLAPFEVYAHIFLAKVLYPDLLAWVILGLALNMVLLVIVIRLDGRSCEASTAAGLAFHQRWARARRSGLPWGVQPLVVRSFLGFPKFGGIGPIAWRQLLSAYRSSGGVLWGLISLAVVAGPLLVMAREDISKASLIGGIFIAAVFVLPRALVFDFRGDLDAMDNFKRLPLPPWKICIGQLVAPVLLTVLIELFFLCSAALFLDSRSRDFTLAVSLFLVPFNLLLYGIENLFFLLFPARLVPIGRFDFDFLGRTFAVFVVIASVLIGSCLLAVFSGQAVMTFMAWPWPVYIVVAWLTLALIALLMLPLLNWAFKRFDVNRG